MYKLCFPLWSIALVILFIYIIFAAYICVVYICVHVTELDNLSLSFVIVNDFLVFCQVDIVIRPGLVTLSWFSMNLTKFFTEFRSAIIELSRLITTVRLYIYISCLGIHLHHSGPIRSDLANSCSSLIWPQLDIWLFTIVYVTCKW